MNCKFCNAELEEGMTICPNCGKDTSKEEITEVETSAPATEKKEPAVVVMTKTQLWQLIVGVAAAVALLAALAVVLIGGIKFDWAKQDKKTDNTSATNQNDKEEDPFVPFDNGVSYTVSDQEAWNAATEVVATMGGKTLTNGALRLYYHLQVTNFVNSNTNYLTQMGLDYKKPLDQQQCYYDETLTWQQYFVNQAIESWKAYQGVCLLAEQNGYKPDKELQAELDDLEKDVLATLKEEGYEDGEKWIQEMVGVGATMQDYLEYYKLYCIAADYTNTKPSAEEIAKYFKEHEKEFEENGVTKDSGPMVDVRHILVCPEGGTTTNNVTTYSEEEWAACLKEAEAVLAQWKKSGATEENFAKLANELSEDGGSNTTGGLYAGVTKETQFVEPFLDWCMDESRKVGDTGIVKTDYGYHIMYFSATQQLWEYYAEVSYLSEQSAATIAEAKEKFPAEQTVDNVRLAELSYVAS